MPWIEEKQDFLALANGNERLAFILAVLGTTARWECQEQIWWTTDCQNPPQFLVTCNDLFFWGSADAEELTPANVAELERAYADADAADSEGFGHVHGGALFCCRMRRMRPQGRCYPKNKKLWPLFDACGPEREIGFGNPYPPGKTMP